LQVKPTVGQTNLQVKQPVGQTNLQVNSTAPIKTFFLFLYILHKEAQRGLRITKETWGFSGGKEGQK
jgi:hypothetical protein